MGMFNGDTQSMITQGPPLIDKANVVLDLILEALDTKVSELAITNISNDPGLQKDFPTPGSQRWIIHRIANGGNVILTAATPTDIVKSNVNRLGGLIVNYGEKPVILTLASTATDLSQDGLGEIAIPANGSWNFKISDAVWCGEVNAEAIGGESKLSVVEL